MVAFSSSCSWLDDLADDIRETENDRGANHLYSVAALTDNTGNVVERYRYDAYGQRTVLAADGVTTRTSSLHGNQVGFTGRYLDKETGLWYFRARYYSGSLGRFLSWNSYGKVFGWSMSVGAIAFDPETGWVIDGYHFTGRDFSDDSDINYVEDYTNVILWILSDNKAAVNYVDGYNLYFGAFAERQTVDPSGQPIPLAAWAAVAAGAAYKAWRVKKALEAAKKAKKAADQAAEAAKKKADPSPTTCPGTTAGGKPIDKYGNPLGPSGKPQVDVVKHPTRKDAKDAARDEGKGAPEQHPSPTTGGPHYHPTGPDGSKLPTSPHHEYPK